MNPVLLVIIVFVVMTILYAIFATPEQKAKDRRKAAQRRAAKVAKSRPISQVGKVEGATGLACPKCGGNQFKARRSNGKRVALAPMAILTPLTSQNQVQCVTCGAKYGRG